MEVYHILSVSMVVYQWQCIVIYIGLGITTFLLSIHQSIHGPYIRAAITAEIIHRFFI